MQFPKGVKGLRLDRVSWEKGYSDGERGLVWWPGAGIEPLSYATGYLDGNAERDINGPQPAQAVNGRHG
jgi:hypothetical protein